jgi:hypothetical protein
MDESKIRELAERLPLDRLKGSWRWHYTPPGAKFPDQFLHRPEKSDLPALADKLLADERLDCTKAELIKVLEYARCRPELWEARGIEQYPDVNPV